MPSRSNGCKSYDSSEQRGTEFFGFGHDPISGPVLYSVLLFGGDDESRLYRFGTYGSGDGNTPSRWRARCRRFQSDER